MRMIPLTRLPGEVAKLTGRPPLPYRRYYLMILDGKLAAEQDPVTGRYSVDLDLAAQALGLIELADA